MIGKDLLSKSLLIILIFCIIITSGCTKEKYDLKSYYTYFDTYSQIINYNKNIDFTILEKEINDILNKYHNLLDIYHSYDNVVNLHDINNSPNKTIKVSDELFDFLKEAVNIYYQTNKHVNIMLGSVTQVWKESIQTKDLTNIDKKINESKNYIDINNLTLDEKNKTVKINEFSKIDPGAIAKGYVLRVIKNFLENKNYTNVLIDLGGNITIIGDKNGKKVKVGVKNPFSSDYAEVLQLSSTSIATSGNYERYEIINDFRIHHIIDVNTLSPSNYFSSVSVICDDPLLTDVYSTYLFTISYDDGRKISLEQNIKVIWIDNTGDIFYSYK